MLGSSLWIGARERLANAARERIIISQEERQRLGDAVTPTMKQEAEPEEHQGRIAVVTLQRTADGLDDHLEAVKASLREKVSALEENNWMFEPEAQIYH